MQTKDIKVGEFYAHKRGRYGSVERVKVLATGVQRTKAARYGTEQTVGSNGVQVEFDNGRVLTVRPQDIQCLWAEHEESMRKAAEYKKQARQRREREYAERAKTAFALHQVLLAKGVRPIPGGASVFDPAAREALRAAGFERLEGTTNLVSTFADIDDIVCDDQFRAADLIAVLVGVADAETMNSKWSWDYLKGEN